ncbi:ISL3 family transposase [Chroococcus sp. FPU101]|uniref:ISL3 family transposase n=1 Tax=Chroococcus sp. FPU101 TaxID=1974212 RepID=UPI001A8DFBCE|nr:ISL3 family transposase [Chroococcus sp. FPU101]GFE69057.1 hypothetical protein CFPU101_16670 [Chroococcus sp. FPU101]
MITELLQHLLPNQQSLGLVDWDFDENEHQVLLTIASVQTVVACPLCGQTTHRIHSHYERTLQDLRWADYSVKWQLQVRKFFCLNSDCERRIFTERLSEVTEPWARRTCRLAKQLKAIGLALGGAAGVRLSRHLGINLCRNTILNLIAKLPLPSIVVPEVLGVDDFAFRKRQSYGTILVDLEQHRPIALLKDRSSATLTQWLQEYQGVQVLSRDRSKEYRQGMTQGSPESIQVADRFHLLHNLTEVLQQIFRGHRTELRALETTHHSLSADTGQETLLIAEPINMATKCQKEQTQQRHQQRLANYQKIWQLHQQDWAIPVIAQRVGVSSRTVKRYLQASNFPERQPRSDRGSKILIPYKDYLLQRWNEGIHQVTKLFEEIQQRGYNGSYMTQARLCTAVTSS